MAVVYMEQQTDGGVSALRKLGRPVTMELVRLLLLRYGDSKNQSTLLY